MWTLISYDNVINKAQGKLCDLTVNNELIELFLSDIQDTEM